MTEVSTVLFSLLVEGFFVLLIILLVLLYRYLKLKKKDRVAVDTLVKQVKTQSKLRLEKTGSFLHEKYSFEGNELEKAVEAIDRAEKKFLQKMINLYLQRDTHGMVSLDASVAELIEAYKELSPIMPDAETLAKIETMSTGSGDLNEEMGQLQELNRKLTEELSITKETMGNMIAEFGNMFGGGKENQLEHEKVLEKVIVTKADIEAVEEEIASEELAIEQLDPALEQEVDIQIEELGENEILPEEPDVELDHEESLMEDLSAHNDLMEDFLTDEIDEDKKEEDKKKEVPVENNDFNEGIDDLLDGIDLSDDS